MNFLIVMPKGSSSGQTTHDIIFPIGIAYVSAALKASGYSVFTTNLEFAEGATQEVLQRLIRQHNIDVVCTGGLSRDYRKIQEVLQVSKACKPGILTVVGGGILTADPVPSMNVLQPDIGVIGEGEITICELAHALENQLPLNPIAGLIFRNKEGEYVITSPREEIKDINTIPFPDLEGFDYGKYGAQRGGLIVGSRSCPCLCTYCFHPSGRLYRQRTLDNIFQELEYQIATFGIRDFGFSDELFANKKNRIMEFCERIKQYGISWVCALRVSDVDLEMLQAMRAAGCNSICYGLESADDRVLKSMRKNITAAQIENALTWSYEAKIRVIGQFIFGDVSEDRESVQRTLDFWWKHNMQTEMSLNMIIAYPGSILYKDACANGKIPNKEQFLIDGCPLINLSKLTDQEYQDLFALTEELKLHPHTLAKRVEILELNDQEHCKVALECRRCDHRSQLEMFFWFKHALICPGCGLINEVDPFEAACHEQSSFLETLPAEGDIALWGCGGIYYKLMQRYPELKSPRFLLVDGDPDKQGLKICGKTVLPPEHIANNHLESVIITAMSRKSDIQKTIEERFPLVKQVFIPKARTAKGGIAPVLQNLVTANNK